MPVLQHIILELKNTKDKENTFKQWQIPDLLLVTKKIVEWYIECVKRIPADLEFYSQKMYISRVKTKEKNQSVYH